MKKYFADKAHIFSHQTKNDTLVMRPAMKQWIARKDVAGKLVVADKKSLRGVKLKVLGEHQAENLACAYEVAKLFGLKESAIKKSLAGFKGLEGRMELLREVRGIKIYNDNNATTPQATSAGLTALAVSSRKSQVASKRTILIAGGNDKNIDLEDLVKAIKKFAKAVYLTPGNGTDKLKSKVKSQKSKVIECKNLKEAVILAMQEAKRGDSILFSPAFSSFAQYNNEYERNDEFIRIVKRSK